MDISGSNGEWSYLLVGSIEKSSIEFSFGSRVDVWPGELVVEVRIRDGKYVLKIIWGEGDTNNRLFIVRRRMGNLELQTRSPP